MQLESINHLSGVYSSLITSLFFSLTRLNCFTGAGIFTVFSFAYLSCSCSLYADAVTEAVAFVVVVATASREYTNYVNFGFFIQNYSN